MSNWQCKCGNIYEKDKICNVCPPSGFAKRVMKATKQPCQQCVELRKKLDKAIEATKCPTICQVVEEKDKRIAELENKYNYVCRRLDAVHVGAEQYVKLKTNMDSVVVELEKRRQEELGSFDAYATFNEAIDLINKAMEGE